MIGIAQTFIVVLFAVFWFDIPMRGMLLPLYFGIFIFTLSTVGTGLAISSISQTMQQAMIFSFVLIVPMVIPFRFGHSGLQHAGDSADSDLC